MTARAPRFSELDALIAAEPEAPRRVKPPHFPALDAAIARSQGRDDDRHRIDLFGTALAVEAGWDDLKGGRGRAAPAKVIARGTPKHFRVPKRYRRIGPPESVERELIRAALQREVHAQ